MENHLKTSCEKINQMILDIFRKNHPEMTDEQLMDYIESVKPERPDKYEKEAYEILKQKHPDMDEQQLKVYAANSMPTSMFEQFKREHFHRKGVVLGTPPSDYFNAQLGKCHTEVSRWVNAVEHGETNGIVIYGKTGRGKTYTALAALNRLAEHNSVGYTSDVEILTRIKESFEKYSDTEQQIIDKFTAPYVLLIDDLGKANPTSWSVSYLFTIINERIELNRPTIITTQYGEINGEEDLLTRLESGADAESAAAIVSRVFRGFEQVHLDGEDRRISA